MRNRYLVLALTSVLALAVAVPAIGQSSDPTATTSNIPKKWKKKIRKKASKKKVNALEDRVSALEGQTDDLNVRVTNLEADGGGPGAPGAPGEAGEPGAAGAAGPGQAFGLTLDDETETITGDGFSLRFSADEDGICGDVRIREETETDDAVYWLANNTSGATTFTELGDDEFDDLDLLETTEYTITAMHPGTGGTAQFQFIFQDEGSEDDCLVGGSVIADS